MANDPTEHAEPSHQTDEEWINLWDRFLIPNDGSLPDID